MLSVDALIFVCFLAVNLCVGLYFGRGVTTMSDYAIGNRNFSTAKLTSTLVATWVAGSFFAFNLTEAYRQGLPFIIMVFGDAFSIMIFGYFYAPRISEFLGCKSVSDVMGKLYGPHIRVITAVSGIAVSIGIIGLQVKLLSNIVEWTFNIQGSYIAAIASTCIVVLYSAFGGIRSVTFTDVFQFITFGTLIPGLCLLIWQSDVSMNDVSTLFHNDARFTTDEVFTWEWWYLFLWFMVPGMMASPFQRTLMAKNSLQAKKVFIFAGLISFVIIAITSWISVLLLAGNPGLVPDKLIVAVLDSYSITGIKGLTLAGIAAMVMGSADSAVHTSAVQFSVDIYGTFNRKLTDKQLLFVSRIFAVIMGIVALIIALMPSSLLELTLLVTNFYLPIVTVPLTLAIFGFRSTSKTVICGMVSGFLMVLFWRHQILPSTGIDSVMPAMFTNLVAIFLFHYLTGQSGGWVGIKDDSYLQTLRMERESKLNAIKKK